ncbi:MAG: DNA polymerase III subunit delta' [Candidatus Omnitrophica bacterium]|nr:DNA polymerase III subunit delta' [Candidatus Omnitrophota bacterium]
MSWSEILGQDLAKRTLSAHLASGKTAGAYLFAGPEGVGKRLLVLELAKALNCTTEGSRPCDRCVTCQQITKGIHPDVHRVTPSGASNQIRIDDIRQVLERIGLRPYNARVQVAILEQAERLNEEAANSLLKSLEEPTTFTRFLLTTNQLPHCLPTIVSRCQILRCPPLPREIVQRILLDRHGCDPRTAEMTARLSQGSVSRALELADRWTDYERLLNQLADFRMSEWMETPLPESRQDVTHLLDGMVVRLRDRSAAAAGEAARSADVDRWVETAFDMIALRESLEQFVSPRLVAALAREKWLSLTEVKRQK